MLSTGTSRLLLLRTIHSKGSKTLAASGMLILEGACGSLQVMNFPAVLCSIMVLLCFPYIQRQCQTTKEILSNRGAMDRKSMHV